jgi:F0F1-type ATP synthase membrane subunit b/b'
VSLHDKIAAIEAKVAPVLHHLEQEAKAEVEQLLADAKAEAAKVRDDVEATVRGELADEIRPIITDLREEAEQAIEAAGPKVTAAVQKAIAAAVAKFGSLIGENL